MTDSVGAEILWHHSKHDAIKPFNTADECFDDTKMRLLDSLELTAASLLDSDLVSIDTEIQPSAFLKINEAPIIEAGYETSDLNVSFIVRDRDLNQFNCVFTDEASKYVESPQMVHFKLPRSKLFTGSKVDIELALYEKNAEPKKFGRVLGRRLLKIRSLTQAFKIPHRIVSSDEIASEGYPSTTPWLLYWQGQDFSRPLSELVEIWFNEDYEYQFQKLSGSKLTSAESALSSAINGQVLNDICSASVPHLLTGESFGEESALEQIKQIFVDYFDIDSNTLKSRLSRPEAQTFLRTHCYEICNYSTRFDNMRG